MVVAENYNFKKNVLQVYCYIMVINLLSAKEKRTVFEQGHRHQEKEAITVQISLLIREYTYIYFVIKLFLYKQKINSKS